MGPCRFLASNWLKLPSIFQRRRSTPHQGMRSRLNQRIQRGSRPDFFHHRGRLVANHGASAVGLKSLGSSPDSTAFDSASYLATVFIVLLGGDYERLVLGGTVGEGKLVACAGS